MWLQYDDYVYDPPGSSASSSPSPFKKSAIYGSYAGMIVGGIVGILLLAVIIYALVVNSRKKVNNANTRETRRHLIVYFWDC